MYSYRPYPAKQNLDGLSPLSAGNGVIPYSKWGQTDNTAQILWSDPYNLHSPQLPYYHNSVLVYLFYNYMSRVPVLISARVYFFQTYIFWGLEYFSLYHILCLRSVE